MKSLTAQQANQKRYFDQHTKVDTMFFTTDGQCFFNINDAENHAKHLEFHKLGKRDVETVTRVQVEAWGTAKASKDNELGKVTAPVKGVDNVPDGDAQEDIDNPGTIEEAEEEIPPYSEWTKKELTDECKVRDIELTGKETKAKLVELLEEYDANEE